MAGRVSNKQHGIQMVRPAGTKELQQGEVCRVAKKNHDNTPPATPQLVRAIAFDKAKEGSEIQPPAPAPAPRPPRRDPVLVELRNIEMNATIEFISLSDDPAASFEKSKVFQLPITGYDEQTRQATIALDAELMKEKGLEGGEQLVIRQVDKNGNESDGIFVYLDPNGWANQNINQPTDNGGTETVRGAEIQFQVGLHGVEGADQMDIPAEHRASTQRLLGVGIQDTSAPLGIRDNVAVNTIEWTDTEKSIAEHLLNGPGVWNTIQNSLRGNISRDELKTVMENPGNYGFDAKTFEFFEKLLGSDEMFDRMASATNGPNAPDQQITQQDLQQIVQNDAAKFLTLDQVFEPGVTGTVRNNGTGKSYNFSLAANTRTAQVNVPDLEPGHQVVIEFRDRAGNAGVPIDFEYDPASKDGKLSQSPLQSQINAMINNPVYRTIEVGGTTIKQVPPQTLNSTSADAWLVPRKGKESLSIINAFAENYAANAQRLGLPKGNEKPTETGAEQEFDNGKMVWNRANNQVTVQMNEG